MTSMMDVRMAREKSDSNMGEALEIRSQAFLRWINHSLRNNSIKISKLAKDLENGTVLINLLQFLSPEKTMPGRYYSKTLIKIQKIQNLTVALRFITDVEKIPIDNIKPSDILENKDNSILNLLWSLVVHYRYGISQEPTASPDVAFYSLRKKLLIWVNCILPDTRVTNFHSDWRDGTVLSALMNYFVPGSIPDIDPSNPAATVENAIDLAETELGIPKILKTGHVIDENSDERAMMLYLSYFVPPGRDAFLKWAKDQIPNRSLDNFSQDWTNGLLLGSLLHSVSGGNFPSHSQMRSGDGLPNTTKSMQAALSMLGIQKTVTDEQFNSPTLGDFPRLSYLSQFYRASLKGITTAPIPTSPHKVIVGQVQVPREIAEDKYVWLEVDCSDAGYGHLAGKVEGKNTGSVPVIVKPIGEDDAEHQVYHVLFTPPTTDIFTFSIFYDGEHVPGSPMVVNLNPPDPNKVKHIETLASDEREDVVMTFDTSDAGRGKLKASAVGEIGGSVPIKVSLEPNGTYVLTFAPPFPDIFTVDVLWGKFSANAIGERCGLVPLEVVQDDKRECSVTFRPPSPDVYVVDVNWDGMPVPGSPFTIDLLPPCNPEEVESALPIFSSPGEEAELLVDASAAGSGDLKAYCIGSEVGDVPVQLNSLGGRAYQILFTPPQADLYSLSVTYGGTHIKGSPFEIDMRPGVEPETGAIEVEMMVDPTRCNVVETPRVENIVLLNRPIVFTVDTQNAGPSELVIEVEGPSPAKTTAVERPGTKGIYDITFQPSDSGSYSINVLWSNKPIPGAPINVKAINNSGIKVCPHGQPVDFDVDVDCKVNELESYAIHNDSGKRYKTKISRSNKGKYKLSFSPKDSGLYFIHVLKRGAPITGSPFPIYYNLPSKPEACHVEGFSSVSYMNFPVKFHVDASEAGSGDLLIQPIGPRNEEDDYDLSISDNKDFTYSAAYTPQVVGSHNLTVFWGGTQIPGSPFNTTAKQFDVEIYAVEDLHKKSQKLEKLIFFEEVANISVDKAVLIKFKLDEDLQLKNPHVTSKVLGQTTGKTRPKIKKAKDGTYNIIFEPSEPDTYTITAEVNKTRLPRTPITVVVADSLPIEDMPSPIREVVQAIEQPEEESVPFEQMLEQPKPKEIDIEVGKELRLKVRPQTDEQREGKLIAKVNGRDTGPGKLKINQNNEGIFEVTFNPTKPDHYVIEMTLNGKEVPSSPFYINYYEKPVKEQSLELDFSQQALGTLTAQCFGDSCGEIPVEIVETAPGSRKYKLKIKPEKEDRYVIYVRHNGKEIKDSPFIIDLKKPSQEVSVEPEEPVPVSEEIVAEELKATEYAPPPPVPEDESEDITPQEAQLAEFTQYIGKALNVKITPETEEQRQGEVNATVVGDKSGEGKVRTYKLPDETFIVEFNPEVPDRYTVTIKLNDMDVPHTPFVVKYIMPKADPSKCRLIGKDEISQTVDVGTEISLLVDASKCGPGELNVKSTEPTEFKTPSILTVSPRSGEKSMYDVHYTPNSHGYHSLEFTWAGKEIPDSPVNLLAVDVEKVKLFYYGSPIVTEFTTDGKDPKLKIIHKETGAVIKGKLSKVQKGKYKVTFSPKEPGLYYIHVYSKDKEIPSSPYVVKFGRPPKPEECKVIGLEESCFLGESVNFTVETKEAGDGELKINAIGPDKKATGRFAVEDMKDNTYSVTFTPERAGDHKINVAWSDKPILGSPYPIKVRDLSREQLITKLYLVNRVGYRNSVDFPYVGILESTTDLTTLLSVKTRTIEQRNGKFFATATNSETQENMPVQITMENDTYFVSFQPNMPGSYSLSAKLNDEEISGLPLYLEYTVPPAVASECRIIGLEDHPMIFRVEKNIFFQIDTRLAGEGKISIKAKSPRGQPTLEAIPNNFEKRIIDVTYVPNVPGTHKVSVAWSGEELPKSPLYFEVEPIPVFPNGRPVVFDLEAEAKESDLHCLVFHEDSGSRLKGKIAKVQTNKFNITFKPRIPGLYSINVYVKMREIRNSPFYIRYAAPPKPNAVLVSDIPEMAYIKEAYSFTVDTREAGISELKVDVTSPEKRKPGILSVVDHKDGIYTVDHTPEVAGSHTFKIIWDNKPVPDSPVTVDVSKRAPVVKSNIGAYTNIIPVGSTLIIDIDNVGKHEDPYFVRAVIEPGKSGSKGTSIIERRDLKHSVQFTPTVADDYMFHLFMHDNEVEGSPFLIKAIDRGTLLPSFERSAEYLPSDVEPGKWVNFIVPWGDIFRDDNTNVSVVGPEGTSEVNVIGQEESSKGINFIPSVPGDYIIRMGEDFGSDKSFKIHATEKKPGAWLVVLTPESVEKIGTAIPVGETEEFDIDTSKSGPGKLKASQKGEGRGTMSLRDKGNDIYGLSITPTSIGMCDLDILMNNESIKDSPFSLQFSPSLPKADKCFLEDITELSTVDTPITFTVNAKDGGNGELNIGVTVPGERPEEEPEFKIAEKGDQIYKVEYVPSVQGDHTFDVKWSEQSIPGSPFVVPVSLPVTESVDALLLEEPEYTLPEVPEPEEEMEIDLSKEGPGMLTAQCFGDTCGEIPVEIIETAPDSKKYKLRIKPKEEDRYTIHVKHNDKEIRNSPFIVDLRKPATQVQPEEETPEQVPISEVMVAEEMKAEESAPPYVLPEDDETEEITPQDAPLQEFTQCIGQALNIKIRPETDEERKGKVEATVVGDNTGEGKVEISKLPDDTFIVRFNPEELDRYLVTVKLNDVDIPHTPFFVNYVMPKTDPSKCRLIGKDEISHPTEMGTEISLLVDASDAGPGELDVTSESPSETDNASTLTVQRRTGEKSKYEVYYTPNSQGHHTLIFTWAGEEIPKSPVSIFAVDTDNVELFYYGKPVAAEFDIDGKDLKLKVIHKETGSIVKSKLSKVQKGKYRATFSPKDPGLYYLHIYSKEKEIPSSPYVVKYGRPPKPEECKVIGLEESCFLGESLTFTVETKEAGDGELKVNAVGPDKKKTGKVTIEDMKDSTYTVAFTPEKAGHQKINVLWSDKSVPGSPYPIKVRDLSREQLITKLHLVDRMGIRKLLDFPYEGILKTTTDQTVLLTVKTRTIEQRNGKFDAMAINTETEEAVSIQEFMENDTYHVLFEPSSPGSYRIFVKLNEVQISGLPLNVEYATPPPVASECRIIGLEDHPLLFRVGKNIFFQIDTRLAGEGKINIKAESPRGQPSLEAKPNNLEKRIIDVIYIPNAPGKHKVSVTWSGEELPRSPLYFEVEPIPVYPNGKPIAFDLETEVKESDFHCLVFHEDSGSRLKTKSNKLQKNKFNITFKPKIPGLYSINVYAKMREIKNSPFFVRYAAPPRPDAVIVQDVPEEAYIKESYKFTADAKNAGISELKVKVTPPKKGKGGVLSVVDHKDGIYTIDHTPEIPGSHSFSILWGKQNIPQSPITVSVKKRVPALKSNLGTYTNVIPVGDMLTMVVDNVGRHEPKNFVKAVIKPRESGSKDRPTITNLDGKHLVHFTPSVADDYILHLLMHEAEVEGSPFLIKAIDKETISPAFERPADNLPSDVECKKPVTFIVPWGELFTDDNTDINVVGPEGPCEISTCSQLESSKGINFVPTVPGDYFVNMTKDAELDEGKSFKIHATEKKTDPKMVFFTPESMRRMNDSIPVGQTQEFDIDTSKAGYGRLKARQRGQGKGRMALRDKGNNIYALSITPSSAGRCELDVLMNDESIRDSPFNLDFSPSLPKADQCYLEDVTESSVVNTPITFTVNAKEAGSGELSLSVNVPRKKPDEEPPTFNVNETEDHTYAVEYVPNVHGDHIFDVKWADQSIPGSPFTVPVSDYISDIHDVAAEPLPISETVDVTPLTQPEFQVFEIPPLEESVDLDFSQEGPGTLSAQCFGDSCGEIPVEIVETAPEKYKLRINPEQEDCYSIYVKYNNKEIKQSPFIIDLRKPAKEPEAPIEEVPGKVPVVETFEEEKVEPIQFALPELQPDEDEAEEVTPQDSPLDEFTQYVGRMLNVKIRPETEEQAKGTVKATVVGERTGEGKLDISQLPDDTFIVRFNPEEPDRYTVTVKLNEQDVPHTPFIVNYILPKTDPSKCKLIGKDEITHPTEVGSEISLLVDARDAGPGELNVTTQKPTEAENPSILTVHPRSGEKSKYEVYYTPNSHGYHNLEFTWAGQPIPDSPVNLLAVDTTKAELFRHGKAVATELNVEGKDLKLKIVHKETGTIIKGKLSKVQKGKYKATFSPKLPGLYYLHVYSKDQEVPSSPFIVRYGNPPKAEYCKVTGLEESCYLGESIGFTVDSTEAGDGDLKITTTGPDKKAPGKITMNDMKDGTYSVVFSPERAGDHKVNVLWSEKAIPGSPYKVKVRDFSREQLITRLFLVNRVGDRMLVEFPTDEVLNTETDQTLLFIVKTRTAEQKNGKFSAVATSTESQQNVPVQISSEDDNFLLRFEPPKPGHYSLTAQLNDQQIVGMPLQLQYSTPAPVASQCKIIGLEKLPPTFSVGKNIFFQIDTRLAGNGKIGIKGQSPRGKPNLEGKPNNADNRIIDVTYIPNAPGTHKVSASWSGEEIPQSPLYFEVEPIPVYPNGKPIGFDLDVEAKESELHCLVFHEDSGHRIKCKIDKLEKNRYSIKFKPSVPGLYSIHVYVKMREIGGSPFYVRYSAPPRPDAVLIHDVPEMAYINEAYNFLVDAKDAGMSELTVQLTPPKKGKNGTLSVVNHKDGIYTVDHTPEVAGKHIYSIVWAKKKIPQSPITVNVSKRVPVVKSNLGSTNIIPVGNVLIIDVENVGMHEDENFIRAVVKPYSSGSKDIPIIVKSNGKHSIHFTPTVEDDYSLNLFMHDTEVEGSPLLVKAIDKSTLSPNFQRPADYLPTDVECGKPVTFVVPWGQQFNDDNTDITVIGPEGPCVTDMNSQLEETKGLSFIPTVPGDYLINMTADAGTDEDNSYKIHATGMKIDAGLVFLTPPSMQKIREPILVGKTEEFDIDTSKAGHGHLKARQQGQGKGKMTLRDKGNDIYGLKITPTSAGTCDLDILMNDESIKDSPFTLQFAPSLPKSDQCFLEDVTESSVVNTPITFIVNAKEAGSGELHLGVNVPRAVPGEEQPTFKVNETEDQVYAVEFVPNVPGDHTFDVKWSDQSVPGSPFTVPVSEDEDLLGDMLDSITAQIPVHEVIQEEKETVEEAVPTEESIPGLIEEPSEPKEIEIEIGKPLKLKVRPQTDKQREGKLVATVTGRETGPGDLQVSQTDEGIFEIKFNPSEPDHYVINMELNGEKVPSSPFYVHYYERPIQPESVDLDFSKEEQGTLTAQCFGDIYGEIPVDILESSPGSKKYKLRIKPEKEDRYSVYVRHNDREIKDSPFVFDLRKPAVELPMEEEVPEMPVSEEVTVEEVQTEQMLPEIALPEPMPDEDDTKEITPQDTPMDEIVQYIGRSLNVKIRPETEEQRNGEVKANIIGENTGEGQVGISKLPDDTFLVRFNPDEPDRYTVTVKLNDVDVPHTPFVVRYIMPTTDPTKCKLIGKDDIAHPVELGTEIPLLVDATDAGPGDLGVTAQEPEETESPSQLTVRPRSGEKSKYDVSYVPNKKGYHTLEFTWDGKPIPESPVSLLAVDTENVELFQHGKPVAADINTDAKDLKLKVVHKETGSIIKGKLNKIQKGKYKATFSPKEPGLYYLHVYSKDKEIPPSPFVIKYGKPIRPEECRVVGLEETCYLGESLDFIVDANNAGDGDLQMSVMGSDKKPTGQLSFTDNKDGTYDAKFDPEKPGDHKISILWGEKPIPGSPFSVRVRDLADEQLISKLYLIDRVGDRQSMTFPCHEDRLVTTTDQTLLLTVKARTDDQRHGVFSATVKNASTQEIVPTTTKLENDTFHVHFQTFTPGNYTLFAELNKEKISGTPLNLEYSIPPPKPSGCKIIGLEDHPTTFSVGKNIFFQIDTRLAGDGKISVKAKSPRGKPNMDVKPNSSEKRIVDVTYIPNVPGTHKVGVAWSGEELARSPLHFEVEPIPVYPNGRPIAYDLDIEAKESDLHCLVFHEDSGTRLKGKISKLARNKFSVNFKPRIPGLYSINVYIKMREVKNSPFYVRYASPPKPDAVLIQDIPEEAYIHEPYSFTVDAKDAGISQLKVKVAPPKRGKDGELNITDHKDGIYTVQHIPRATGKHSFDITWDKKAIPGVPLMIDVQSRDVPEGPIMGSRSSLAESKSSLAPSVEVSEEVAHKEDDAISVISSKELEALPPQEEGKRPRVLFVPDTPIVLGESIGIDIDVKDIPRGALKVNQHGDGKAGVQFKKKSEGIIGCTVTPTALGTCHLNFLFNDESIDGSPCTLKYFALAGVDLEGEAMQVGILHKFSIGCGAIHEGNLEVICGDDDFFAADINTDYSEEDQAYHCSILPKEPGPNTISVKYNGHHIIGSPFNVEFISQAQSSLALTLVTPTGVEQSGLTANIESASGRQVIPVNLSQLLGGQYSIDFVPTQESEYQLTIKCNLRIKREEKEIAQRFNLNYTTVPVFATACQVEGEGIGAGEVGMWSTFTVKAKDEEGELFVNFDDLNSVASEPIITTITPSLEYEVKYLVKKSGNFRIALNWNGKSIPGSPFDVVCTVPENIVPADFEAYPATVVQGKSLQFSFKPASDMPGSELEVSAFSKTVGVVMGSYEMTSEGKYNCNVQLEHQGRYLVQVNWDNRPVEGTPFEVEVVEQSHPENVRVFGPGLKEAAVGERGVFTIDTSEAGHGNISVNVTGPEGQFLVNLEQDQDQEKVFHASYLPQQAGQYIIDIMWGGEQVPNSPFIVNI